MEYYDHQSEKPFEEWILDKNVGTHNEISERSPLNDFAVFRYIYETKCNKNYAEYVKFFKDVNATRRVTTGNEYLSAFNEWESFIDWLRNNEMANESISTTGKRTHLSLAEYRWDKLQRGLRFYSDEPTMYFNYSAAMTGKNVQLTLHPTEMRYLTWRETMSMMGLPQDFKVTTKNIAHITQNVPVCTAKDMTEQAIKFINGQLKMTDFKYIKQDNTHQRIDHKE
jgi:site-specific DNA-cytosine methylase